MAKLPSTEEDDTNHGEELLTSNPTIVIEDMMIDCLVDYRKHNLVLFPACLG